MKYYFFAYGSLMDHASLTEGIPDRHFTPVTLKAWRRIFDVRDVHSKDPDVLNIEPARGHSVNGVLFQVSHPELRKLMKRETEYKLARVRVQEFLTGRPLCGCYTVTDRGVGIDMDDRKPNRPYFIACRQAAYDISTDFGRCYDETTFLSDGRKVRTWIKRNRSYARLRKR